MNPGHSEEQERLAVGPFTLVPYLVLVNSHPCDYWAMPGCTKRKPKFLTTEDVMNLASHHGYPVKRIMVQLYRRGDGL